MIPAVVSRYHDRGEGGAGAWEGVDAGLVGGREDVSYVSDERVSVSLLYDDGRCHDPGIRFDEHDMRCPSLGQIDDRLFGDEGFRDDVLVRVVGERREPVGHVSVLRVE